ncbi:MAG: Na/Pi cotransporter family protein [Gammaproteobacteria bacterium]|nr:Na/Pi cotransporter family protein [Gammaproteobacteria bacterium]
MSVFAMISAGIGGLGLFLLGMWLMSDGLRMAAGDALNHFLHHWTKTRLRGLGVGIFLTSLIQSSGAVTVATIGFTNAGLLSLRRAIWIIFGSNIGTTTTGWLVTLIGFNFKISAFALPIIGIGMVLKLVKSESCTGSLGQAMVGFGILFMGIDVLKDTFSLLGEHVSFDGVGQDGLINILLYVGFGFLITVLMQSSSVTLAITLTALAGGIMTLLPAAAIAIGGNLGSTTTAIFSSFGTNAVAKRVVASHVIFNVITAIVSLILITPLLSGIIFVQSLWDATGSTTTTLALFHTVFNVLGVLLMWPFADTLVSWLKNRFKTKDEDLAKPMYLDKHSLSVPSLALHALKKELKRVADYALEMAKECINFESSSNKFATKDKVIESLNLAIGDYTSKLYKQNLTEDISEKLPSILRVSQYYDAISELSVMVNAGKKQIATSLNPAIEEQLNVFYKHSVSLLENASIDTAIAKQVLNKQLEELEKEYQSLKSLLLRRGAEGQLSIAKMDKTMTSISQIRRISQQAFKAYVYYETLKTLEKYNDNDEIITEV